MRFLTIYHFLTFMILSFDGAGFGASLNAEVEKFVGSLQRTECEEMSRNNIGTRDDAISTANILNAAVSHVLSSSLGKDLYEYSTEHGTQVSFLTSVENSGEETDFLAEHQQRTNLIVFEIDAIKRFVQQRRDAGSTLKEAEDEVGRLISPILINELTHSYVHHLF